MRFGVLALMLAGLLAVALAPSASARPGPEPQCMPYYSEQRVGPVTIIRRDSCHAEYYLCGRPIGEALAAEHPLDCVTTT
ncbi:MAG: hypothetical protein QOG31_902 [Thermoplasmata archaeon]|jgi:hypothetical protein|nr:hypothetical protein [Thermoplasmata archaeon]